VDADAIAAAVRAALSDVVIREVKMFGGIGFTLNGNTLVATSKRGLLARVGKDAQAAALARPGARMMEMRGRVMQGYVLVDPSALSGASVASWLRLARAFVATLPPKCRGTGEGEKDA
jgi:TfoX/Sxy family transcriptional regulator of competence genes